MCLIWCCLQDGIRVKKERQRASGRVQQLQAELSAMKSHQDSLRQRLQERLTAQERDAAAKTRELASLRRAGEPGGGMRLPRASACAVPHAIVRALLQYVQVDTFTAANSGACGAPCVKTGYFRTCADKDEPVIACPLKLAESPVQGQR